MVLNFPCHLLSKPYRLCSRDFLNFSLLLHLILLPTFKIPFISHVCFLISNSTNHTIDGIIYTGLFLILTGVVPHPPPYPQSSLFLVHHSSTTQSTFYFASFSFCSLSVLSLLLSPIIMSTNQTTPTWSELIGSNNWEGLLDPLDLDLRKLILRSGDFIQATYDAFNNDQNSKYCGSSRYGKSSFFQKVMLENASDYKVLFFLYGTASLSVPEAFILHSLSRESWDRESNWIGYIAVPSDDVAKASGRREIYLVWRGTMRDYEWINVFGAASVSAKALLSEETIKEISSSNKDENEGMPNVMQGWLTIYTSDNPNSPFSKTSARTQILKKVNELLKLYKDENPSVVILGHSLGASLSILSAFDLVENGVKDVPVTAIVFGSPQVGNKAFNERLKKLTNLKVLHIRNVIDLITRYPGGLLGYVDTSGTELRIDTRKSPSLKESRNPGDWHNLQGMLHVVAGWNGADGEFEMKVKRSVALVNKSCEFLKEEYLVPGSWWVEKNKSMVRRDDGEWVLASPDEDDLPVPED